jgi:HAD superfamily hydrolase (TIGR01549 family)
MISNQLNPIQKYDIFLIISPFSFPFLLLLPKVITSKENKMKYTHIVFDIDGTLIDTESAVLYSFQDTILELQQRNVDLPDLKFTFGIPVEAALSQLGFKDVQAGSRIWHKHLKNYISTFKVFDGIEALLKNLKAQNYQLGIITSKNREEYKNDFPPFGLGDYFDTIISVEDSVRPKPFPDPMIRYLELTGVNKEEVLYIGDSIYDIQCAKEAKVDSGLALWGCHSIKHIYATYYFSNPRDVIYTLNKEMDAMEKMPWLKWAMELQFIAQAGMTYSKDAFDLERFGRLREISAEIMSLKSGMTMEQVRSVFCNETGFQTPKLDTRAAVFQNDKILLVKENDGTWSLPGGWVDVNQSIKSNTIKEVKEEAGLDVVPVKLIAVQDRNQHNLPLFAYGVCKAFVLCELIDGCFISNVETLKSDFFSWEKLPPLSEERNTEAQIKLCFEAYKAKNWDTVFD